MSSLQPEVLSAQHDILFSKLAARGRIGPDFFQRIHAVLPVGDPPRGLIDDLSTFRSAHFHPQELHPAICTFYEQTEQFSLFVRARWKFGFRLGARMYKFFSSRIGQLNFPLEASSDEDLLESRILPLQDAVDGRTRVRAWVRTYKKTREAMYVAAYATHTRGAQTYMNIAFPVPGGNITCIFRVESMSTKGIRLSTFPLTNTIRDEGVYFVNRFLPIRLPAQETIRVWAVGTPGIPADLECWSAAATLLARHDVWLFGIRLLTLDYRIFAL
ncbi:MAG: hypothetical protein JO215_00530 [Ktedonobacteraceae bacterium]|nr:hypothetical protein [Ktedonobacteraceae bacterium]